ncbi:MULTISPECIES: M56 family metallopeptidase [unclassified Sphingomonas]|uniref:M56 family metallopeptidase n=1 Tax=unclassified Sphingomonas TaxID=196159 RepID=UPI000BCC03BA|nr:MAG: hypothetical protein B7Z43_00365 [Sphingomonas sp. 12-62-6]OYX40229.1 MAG: hypothetical protein B7Y98_02510 [Sphingomonas sp. 32-62-10]
MISWAIESLLASAALMLLVLIMRGPVRRAFGPGIAYALWLLPVVRLVLPPMPTEWQKAAAPPITQASESFTVLVIEPLGLGQAAAPVAQGPSLLVILVALWAAGASAFILWHLVAHSRFCRRILASSRQVSPGHIRVLRSDAAAGPLAFGILRKYVAFPSDFEDRYDADERDLALAHELTHHARGDLIANWVALVVLALHWFNPLAWRAFRAFRADQEMACDARVLAGRDAAFTHAYGRAIVKSAHGGAVSAACHLHTINDLKGRLRMLSTTKKSPLRVAGGALSVCAVTLAGLALTASGTQAAERLRSKVDSTIGVELAKLDRMAADAAAPLPTLTPLAAVAGQTVPVPPSAVAPADLPPPPPPPVPGVPDTAMPAPPAPPAPPATESRTRVIVLDQVGKSGKDPKGHREMRFVFRDKDGVRMMAPEAGAWTAMSTSGECSDGKNKDGKIVSTKKSDGKHVIIICERHIEKMAMRARDHAVHAELMGRMAERMGRNAERDAERMAFRMPDIERNAYRSALEGVRNARAGMVANKNLTGEARTSALKAMDEAIAELEANLAKVN